MSIVKSFQWLVAPWFTCRVQMLTVTWVCCCVLQFLAPLYELGYCSVWSTQATPPHPLSGWLKKKIRRSSKTSEINFWANLKITGAYTGNSHLRDVIWENVDFLAEAWRIWKKTLDVTSGFWMSDMRWKALERLIRMSQVSAQGDAAFLPFSSRENPNHRPKPYLG